MSAADGGSQTAEVPPRAPLNGLTPLTVLAPLGDAGAVCEGDSCAL
ncbi:hypothetical protein [Herbiconiux daphne]|uniref:Uncharacterized protein n=1 Tax=Herbiconiux daphne TaxID=2970914 RepID=A0ABT2H1U3_9MICO|nr:hypothetical protein [Herbiconiux daphne]MCS5733906.1 hypothetical protein [Herbiconiux daphne]